MGDGEYLDWLQTLKKYPLSEVIEAANELTINPPEGWTGMPKLPDILRQIHGARIARAEEYRRNEGEKLAQEMRELEKKRQAGEKFYTLADVLKAAPEGRTVKPMPNVRTIFPDIDPDRNKAKLEQQKRDLGQ